MNRSLITAYLFGALLVTTAVVGNFVGRVRGENVSLNYAKIKFDYVQQTEKGITFGGASSFPALPADFFGPGSLPFEGFLPLRGTPGMDPMVVKKTSKESGEKGGTEDINIGVGELNLVPLEPITVNFSDGSTQQWDLTINLNPLEESSGVLNISHNPPGDPDGGTINDGYVDVLGQVTGSPASGEPIYKFFSIVDRTQLSTSDAKWAHSHSTIAGGANRDFVPGADPANPSAPLQVLLFEGGGLDLPLRVIDIVPEPFSLMLLALGTTAIMAAGTRRRKHMRATLPDNPCLVHPP